VKRMIGRRLLQSIPLLLVVSSLTFVLVSLIPGSIATALIGLQGTPAEYAQLEHQLGLDKPVYVQYWNWLEKAFHGNLGASLQNNQSVVAILASRIDVTIILIAATVIVVAVVGMGLGIVAARRGGLLGRILDALVWIGVGVPNFWLGLLFVSVFAVSLHALPAEGLVSFATSPSGWAKSLVLPIIALAAGPVAVVMKQTRDEMVVVLRSEYIRTLRASGVPERSIVFKHALKNAALPVTTVLGVLFINLLSGTVVVETVFALPGLGSLAASAVAAHDLPVVEGVAVYFTLIVIAINLLVDIAYGWLSPKVRVR